MALRGLEKADWGVSRTGWKVKQRDTYFFYIGGYRLVNNGHVEMNERTVRGAVVSSGVSVTCGVWKRGAL